MFASLKRLFHRPAIRLGRIDSGSVDRTMIRSGQFVSFLSASGGFSRGNSDRHDARLRRRRTARNLGVAMLAAGCAWVVIESAHALTRF